MQNIIEFYSGHRFAYKGKKYINLTVDISDFTALSVGEIVFVKATGTGYEAAAIPNADSQIVELAVYTGFSANDFDPRNPDGAAGAAADTATDGNYIFCIQGACNALVNGTSDVAVGDPLEILKNTGNFVLNGTSGTVVYDIKTHAIAGEIVTAAADTLALVYLVGGKITPSAS